MNSDVQNQVIIAINHFIPEMIDDYIDDHTLAIAKDQQDNKTPTDILNLILTLKFWANPDSNFKAQLKPDEFVNFKNLIDILNSPRKILSQSKHEFTPQEEQEIKLAVQIKLNQKADELIKTYQLEKAMTDYEHLPEDEISKWWQQKSTTEQQTINEKFQKLSKEEKAALKQRVKIHYATVYIDPVPDPFWFFWLSHHHCYLSSYSMPCSYFYTPFLLPNLHFHNGGYHTSGGSRDNSCNGDIAKGIGIAAVILAGLAYIVAGTVGALYAAKKAFNSMINICSGNKVLRSMYRLLGIGGGAYGGVVSGAFVGAAMGSIIPGIGTVAGGLLGAIFGAGIGAGVGALLTKYTAKGVSYLFYNDQLNPTNPEKWNLSHKQSQRLEAAGLDLQVIQHMIVAIHREKNKIGISGSFFWTDERQKKNELNLLLENIKNYPDKIKNMHFPITIGNIHYDPYLLRFETEKKSKSYSSTANMVPTLGEKILYPFLQTPLCTNVEPSAPPIENEGEVYCNDHRPPLSYDVTYNYRRNP